MMLALPYPPTANKYWRNWRGRIVKSTDARKYQNTVALLAKQAMGFGAKPMTGEVSVQVSIYRPRRLGDLDNTLKVLLDALSGIVYEDDSQIVYLSARRCDDAANPRAVVSVSEGGQ